jgi:hypothetical protein
LLTGFAQPPQPQAPGCRSLQVSGLVAAGFASEKLRRHWGKDGIKYAIYIYMAMDQYLLIPFLGGRTSIYQLF